MVFCSWSCFFWFLVISAIIFKFYMYLTTGRYRIKKSLSGKHILITGGTSGIGKETVKILAQNGATVHILARDLSKAQTVLSELKEQIDLYANIPIHEMDLSNFQSIRHFVAKYLASGNPIHVLINNAAVLNNTKKITVDGNEEICQVIYFGPFLLTNLLLERMIKSGPGSRIVNLSSLSHGFVRDFDITDLNFERRPYTLHGITAYTHSKLAVIMFTRELANRLHGKGVTANCLHPGELPTPLYRHFGWYRPYKLFLLIMKVLLKTPQEAAQTSIFLAVADRVADISGHYFSDCEPAAANLLALDDKVSKDLWELSEKLTGLKKAD